LKEHGFLSMPLEPTTQAALQTAEESGFDFVLKGRGCRTVSAKSNGGFGRRESSLFAD